MAVDAMSTLNSSIFLDFGVKFFFRLAARLFTLVGEKF